MLLPHALMLFVANGRDNNNALNDYFIRPRMRGRFATHPLTSRGSWHQRWQKSLFLFVCPPLVLLMTALAVLWMGTKGEMLGLEASWFSYILALGFIGWGILTVIKLIGQLWQSQYRIHRLSQQLVMGKTARILEDDLPYSY